MSKINLKTVSNECCGETTYYFNDGENIGIVDPGDNIVGLSKSLEKIHAESAKITILLTHGHYDHIAGVNSLCENFNVENVFIGKNDEKYLYTPSFNLSPYLAKEYTCDANKDKVKILSEGDKVNVGKYEFHVIDTPGHTAGGIMYVCDSEKIVFSGDSLFRGSIGNTSFPGGDHEQLVASVRKAIAMTPDDFAVYPGHDASTSIGREKISNPYL